MIVHPHFKAHLKHVQQLWKETNWMAWYIEFEEELVVESYTTGKGKDKVHHKRRTSKPKYTVDSFSRLKGKNLYEQQFIRWYIGSEEEAKPELNALFKWAGKPQNWTFRRDTGGWASDAFLKNYSKAVMGQQNALDKCKEVGDLYILKIMATNDRILHEIDIAFRGKPCLPQLSDDENFRRAGNYIALRRDVVALQQQALEMYWVAMGVNINDVAKGNVLIENYITMKTQTSEDLRPKTEAELLMADSTKMALRKVREHGTKGPEHLRALLSGRETIDVVPQRVEEGPAKNGKVQ